MSFWSDRIAENQAGEYGKAFSNFWDKPTTWLAEKAGMRLTPEELRRIEGAGKQYDDRGVPEYTAGEIAANTALRKVMEGRVAGTAASPAELQMQAGLARQLAGINAAAASGSGASNPGLALRQALFSGQAAGSAFNQDAAILRAQEQAAAEARLAGLLGQNQGAALQSRGMNDVRAQNAQNLQANIANQQRAARAQFSGAVLGAGGSGLALLNGRGGGGGSGAPDIDFGSGDAVPTLLGDLRPVTLPTETSSRPWGQNPYALVPSRALADGDIVTRPTRAIVGEEGPEAVVPLKTPADAAMAAFLIRRAREKQEAEDRGRQIGEVASRMSAAPDPRALMPALMRERAERQLAEQMMAGGWR